LDSANKWLRGALGLERGETPFPWQEEMLRRFVNGKFERALDIPTGLGKTAVMAIWLVARAVGAPLPRRLVYVVDRRAVVDQATEVAISLRDFVERNAEFKLALGLEDRSLPVSTLRGQYVDNNEWIEDPASCAIIVGTVDMTGSRLLFEGYGVSRKMRPYTAGLLGSDTLVVLDEAHLVPPFEKLLESIAEGGSTFGPRDDKLRELVPSFKLLSLSATGRSREGNSIGLTDADLKHDIMKRRLNANKRLSVPDENPGSDSTAVGESEAPVESVNSEDAETEEAATGAEDVANRPTKKKPRTLDKVLAEHAWKLANRAASPVRCIVFCDRRECAKDTKAAVEKLAAGDKNTPRVHVDTQLFVGGRRVFEREEAARWLKENGFIAGTRIARTQPAFVFATSAGEVGVDLDADHMVCDLVAWERMVQRLGRVNRRGEGKAEVIVVDEPQSRDEEKAREKAPEDRNASERNTVANTERKQAVHELLNLLPALDGGHDASPGALRALKLSAEGDPELQARLVTATTPAPLRPALSRPLVDAWSMTSLKEHTGRPEIDPWLRGWVDEDPPQTAVIWRMHLPVRTRGGAVTNKEIEAFVEAAPPHTSEKLETETFRVISWLAERAKALIAPAEEGTSATQDAEDQSDRESTPVRRNEIVAFALTPANDLRAAISLNDLPLPSDDKDASKRKKEDLESKLAGATLVVDARIGGLKDGLLEASSRDVPHTADDGNEWMRGTTAPVVRFRVQAVEAGQPVSVDLQWRERLRFAKELSDDGEATRWLMVYKWRDDATTEDDRAVSRPQLLGEHQAWAEERARGLAQRLSLPDEYVEMLATAARLHDEGKQAKRWQRAFNANNDGIYAKTRGPINNALLDGYRHEFGSLPFAEKDSRFRDLSEELQDLALHLIAAHHGFARPVIRVDGCEDAPPSLLEERARDVALRFARLQKRWGPWGLAWWEALVRAADQQASRDNDAVDSGNAKEGV
jgi:CRISPR-associated endonuclease/helicase Cas3